MAGAKAPAVFLEARPSAASPGGAMAPATAGAVLFMVSSSSSCVVSLESPGGATESASSDFQMSDQTRPSPHRSI
jgi:hypothetical protein